MTQPPSRRQFLLAAGSAAAGLGLASVIRIRLADTQTVIAICELSDGSFWSDRADVVVTLAACLEEA